MHVYETCREYYYSLINSVPLYLLWSKPYTQETKKIPVEKAYLKNVHSRSETVYKLKQNREIKKRMMHKLTGPGGSLNFNVNKSCRFNTVIHSGVQ